MNKRNWSGLLLIFIGVSGCFSVLLGAWLSHAAQSLSTEQLNRVQIAQQYQILHTITLLVIAAWYRYEPSKVLLLSALGFMTGIMCFSGSLYIKSFFAIEQVTVIAPFGGIALAFAWLLLIVKGFNK
ncbi:DUF423 domain-containing protein [Thalassotalea ganghwensis]